MSHALEIAVTAVCGAALLAWFAWWVFLDSGDGPGRGDRTPLSMRRGRDALLVIAGSVIVLTGAVLYLGFKLIVNSR